MKLTSTTQRNIQSLKVMLQSVIAAEEVVSAFKDGEYNLDVLAEQTATQQRTLDALAEDVAAAELVLKATELDLSANQKRLELDNADNVQLHKDQLDVETKRYSDEIRALKKQASQLTVAIKFKEQTVADLDKQTTLADGKLTKLQKQLRSLVSNISGD